MKSKGFKAAVFIVGMALFGAALAAGTPSVDDIYRAAQAGHLNEAQGMVEQVLAQHPDSAKAHFVAAEIYAREGKTAPARNELQTAQRLQPGLPFANPQSVQKLQAALALPASSQSAPAHSSFPLGSLVLLLVAGFILVMVIRGLMARNNPQTVYPAGQPYPPGGYGPGGYGPGGVYPAPSGGLGSSILGGLATGAAVGAGMVAGEELAHHLLDGGNSQPAQQSNANGDMGGADFGIADAGSWGDNSTFADFSSGDVGGDDWT